LVSIIFFFVGIYYDNFLKINITGTYKNYNYNEPEKVIFFNKDGTCVYIDDNEQCNWKKKDNKVFITITKEVYSESYIEIYLDDNITEFEKRTFQSRLSVIKNITEIFFEDEKYMFRISISKPDYVEDVYNIINNWNEVKLVNKYIGEIVKSKEEYNAIMVDDGLIINSYYFQKIK